MNKASFFRLKKVTISKFHGQELSLDLTNSHDNSTYYFIGQNGSYKSTVLELVYTIFASFNAPSIIKNNDFDYDLEYQVDDRPIYIIKRGEKYYLINPEEEKYEEKYAKDYTDIETLRRHLTYNRFLPEKIISFYSGENDRLKKLESQALRGYYRKFYNAIAKEQKTNYLELPSKGYIHSGSNLIPLLLTIAMSNEDTNSLVNEHCKIDSLERITYYTDLRSSAKDIIKQITENKISLLDYAKSVIRKFDSNIAENIDFQEVKNDDLHNGKIAIILDLSKGLFEADRIYSFFEALTTLYNNGDLEISFMSGGKLLKDTALSQGQRQWIELIGLMALARKDTSILLMDEPDAFMNPVWKYEFNKALSSVEGQVPTGVNLVVTHDPLLINGVPKENIRIFEKTDDIVEIANPTQETYGLGIDGLLKSQYYGLTNTFDKVTSDKFYRRMELYSKALDNELTDQQDRRELYVLTKELGIMPVFNNSIDYLYLDFLKLYNESPFAEKEYLTREELEQRNGVIKNVLNNLYERFNHEIR